MHALVEWIATHVVTCAAAVPLYLLYRAILPRPLPGIPCHPALHKSVLGDIPDAIAYQTRSGEFLSFLRQRCLELDTPICQVYLRVIRRPWVVVMDSQETYQILVRRTPREFERSKLFTDVFEGLTPEFHAVLPTSDRWRANRRQVADLMSPVFFKSVVAPVFFGTMSEMVELWRAKISFAKGKAFDVENDVSAFVLDAVLDMVFGSSRTGTRAASFRDTAIRSIGPIDTDGIVAAFPDIEPPTDLLAVRTLLDSQQIAVSSPLTLLHHKLALALYPRLRSAMKEKQRLFATGFQHGLERLTDQGLPESRTQCAIDAIILREIELAKKESREPQFDSNTSRDELFGFITGSAGTTSTQFMWILAILTKHQDIQQRLRASLLSAFEARTSCPSAEAIAKAHIPYLDAVIEETIRCRGAAPLVSRKATTDVDVLGHRIPAGTDVVMMTMGPGYTAPPFQVPAHKLWQSGSDAVLPSWTKHSDAWSLSHFDPERWLKIDAQNVCEFDPGAAPQLAFGAGVRGCFGQRMARQMLRVAVVVVLWNFKLEGLPSSLAGLESKDGFTYMPKHTYLRPVQEPFV